MFDEYYLKSCFDNAWIALKNLTDGSAILPIFTIIYSAVGMYPIVERNNDKNIMYYHKQVGDKWKIKDTDLFKLICWIDQDYDEKEQELFWQCFRNLNVFARDCLITRFDVQIGDTNRKKLQAEGIDCSDRKV